MEHDAKLTDIDVMITNDQDGTYAFSTKGYHLPLACGFGRWEGASKYNALACAAVAGMRSFSPTARLRVVQERHAFNSTQEALNSGIKPTLSIQCADGFFVQLLDDILNLEQKERHRLIAPKVWQALLLQLVRYQIVPTNIDPSELRPLKNWVKRMYVTVYDTDKDLSTVYYHETRPSL